MKDNRIKSKKNLPFSGDFLVATIRYQLSERIERTPKITPRICGFVKFLYKREWKASKREHGVQKNGKIKNTPTVRLLPP